MKYYLPIQSTTLPHYFACACVKPSKYIENKPTDIQDVFCNELLLSTDIGSKDADCCIELILTKEEEKSLIKCDDCFYKLLIPLPISRVKKIYFRDQRQMEQTLSNINLSAAFIPHSLAEVTQFSNAEFTIKPNNVETSCQDYSQRLRLFDRILGSLALMKIAREPYMNYSENYASTLSFFNAHINEELDRQGIKINKKFFGLFSKSGPFTKYANYLENKITKDYLDKIAAENKQVIERSYTKTINYDKLNDITYIFAILQSYGVGGEAATKKIDSLILNNFKDLKEGMAEGIAFYYGYNRGYSVFNNSYGIEGRKKQTVKFLLDSQLDYYTIESVYQFVFHENTSSTCYPYIDEWCPRKNQRTKRKTDYMVLDTVFIGKKKESVFSKEYFHGLLDEIKSFNFLNKPLSSLIEQVYDRIAYDTKEEIEESLMETIANKEKIIEELQKENERLLQELQHPSIKTKSAKPTKTSYSRSRQKSATETTKDLKIADSKATTINNSAKSPAQDYNNTIRSDKSVTKDRTLFDN